MQTMTNINEANNQEQSNAPETKPTETVETTTPEFVSKQDFDKVLGQLNKLSETMDKRINGLHTKTKEVEVKTNSEILNKETKLSEKDQELEQIKQHFAKVSAKAVDSSLTKELINAGADEFAAEYYVKDMVQSGVAKFDPSADTVVIKHDGADVDVSSWLSHFKTSETGKKLLKVKPSQGTDKVEDADVKTPVAATRVDHSDLQKLAPKFGGMSKVTKAYSELNKKHGLDITVDMLTTKLSSD